jgi:ribose transport system substrate-binding protein
MQPMPGARSHKEGRTSASSYRLETVSRACALLKAFSDEHEGLTLSEIADRTGFEKTIAFRIVHTLEQEGFLSKVGARQYVPRVKVLNQRHFRIGYAAQTSESPFSAAVTESLRWAARRTEIDLIEVDNHYSAKAAVRNAESLIAQRVDLSIEFQTYERIAPTISALFRQANIPLIAVEIPHPGAVYFGIDNYRVGIAGGRVLAKAAKQHWQAQFDELLLLELEIAGSLPHLRMAGVEAALREIMPAKCSVHHLDTRGEFLRAFEAVRRHLRAHAQHRTLIAGVNDPSVLGALRAFEEAGRGDCCLAAGLGATPEARQELRRPGTRLICSLAFFPEHYGENLIQLALDVLHNRQVPPAVYATIEMITPQNVDKFYPTDREATCCEFSLG